MSSPPECRICGSFVLGRDCVCPECAAQYEAMQDGTKERIRRLEEENHKLKTMRSASADELLRVSRYRFHEKSCFMCRYLRFVTTGATTTECLLLGRTIGITTKGNESFLYGWARERICDAWTPMRGNKMNRHIKTCPYTSDPYLKRESLMKARRRWIKRLTQKGEGRRLTVEEDR